LLDVRGVCWPPSRRLHLLPGFLSARPARRAGKDLPVYNLPLARDDDSPRPELGKPGPRGRARSPRWSRPQRSRSCPGHRASRRPQGTRGTPSSTRVLATAYRGRRSSCRMRLSRALAAADRSSVAQGLCGRPLIDFRGLRRRSPSFEATPSRRQLPDAPVPQTSSVCASPRVRHQDRSVVLRTGSQPTFRVDPHAPSSKKRGEAHDAVSLVGSLPLSNSCVSTPERRPEKEWDAPACPTTWSARASAGRGDAMALVRSLGTTAVILDLRLLVILVGPSRSFWCSSHVMRSWTSSSSAHTTSPLGFTIGAGGEKEHDD
jgi:hypothetical protein